MPTLWDDRYRENPNAYGMEPNEFLRSEANRLRPNSEILCLGDGYGRNAIWLAEQGHRVMIVDSSSEGLELAGRLAAERNLTVAMICEDLASYEPQNCDAVVAIFVHLPPQIRIRIHALAWLALRRGGRFILEGFSLAQLRRDTGGPKSPDMLYTAADLMSDFPEAEFDVLEELVEVLQEGDFHQGEADIVRMSALKP